MTDPRPLAPHPELTAFYGDRGSREGYVRKLFSETAGDYDRLENLLGLGSGRWYRRRAIVRAGLVPGMKVLDVATGTGLVAREALGILAGSGSVACVDPSPGMLREAKRGVPASMVLGAAEHLPLRSAQFDFLTMGYALRHVADLPTVFREYLRVLRPGGRLCILEMTRPRTRAGLGLLRLYMRHVFPRIARAATGRRRNEELYQYFWETIEGCVPPDSILEALRGAGFADVKRSVELGLFSDYLAVRP